MKGDFSRLTFARRNHYSSVRMQQGRVQLDADWNEQADIILHCKRTTTRDIIGGCGGPLHDAAFAVSVPARRLVEARDAERRAPDPSGTRPADPSGVRIVDPTDARVVEADARRPTRFPRRANVGDDFTLGAGRYYVDGILCENEKDVLYSEQPDLPDATRLGTAPFDA